MSKIIITVNPKRLAHCRMCRDPLLCIYDWKVRDYCWDCTQDMEGEIVPETFMAQVHLIKR